MENSYESGFAFVLEGATERVFYERLLYFFARKHPNCSIEKNQDSETFETFFTVRGPFGVRIIKIACRICLYRPATFLPCHHQAG